MEVNSFGRKIKNNFSVTFKKDEDQLKLWLNEQAVPAAYIKQLILEDMQRKEANVGIHKKDVQVINDKEEIKDKRDFSDFDMDLDSED